MTTFQMDSNTPVSPEIHATESTPLQVTPVQRSERISSVDVLRGFALLGILVLNIDSFGNPELVHDVPVGTPIDNLSGPHAHLNLILLFIKWMFFEGKMRGLFSMLFGAGVILMTDRAERRGAGKDIADIYLRRNMLLVLAGFLHTALIWIGDILFDYGLEALLFLYPCRKLKAKTLLWLGTALSLLIAPVGGFLYLDAMHDFSLERQVKIISQQKKSAEVLSETQKNTLKVWERRVVSQSITPEKIREAVDEAKLGYIDSILDRIQSSYQNNFVQIHVDLIVDNLSAMLIGMGLMKLGFLTGELANETYAWTAIAGFAISLPLYLAGIYKAYVSGFYFMALERWLWAPYYLGREAGSLAIAAVLLLLIKGGALRRSQQALAAVGRMALSNYLLTSIFCQFLFVWGPWRLFAKLEYFQLMYVVFGVWCMNLIFSTGWLRIFRYGPFEWLWRSLTYGKWQPMTLTPSQPMRREAEPA